MNRHFRTFLKNSMVEGEYSPKAGISAVIAAMEREKEMELKQQAVDFDNEVFDLIDSK
ncbi:MAG: hypothetical protein V3R67_08895 [Thermodesulfobacteriota bacterium]